MGLLLALAKKIVKRHGQMVKGAADRSPSTQLSGKTLGILGLGSVGTEVAKRAKAFDMRIIATKRNPSTMLKNQLGLDFLGGQKDLQRVLKESDFLVVTLPVTPETEGLLGERELKLMKKTAYIISVSRAEVFKPNVLEKAVKRGWVKGAGVDVWFLDERFWWYEASKPRYSFYGLDGVVATPHFADSTDVESDLDLEIVATNVTRVAQGEEPVNLVNKQPLY